MHHSVRPGKILFITRNFSRYEGGKEIFNFNLFSALNQEDHVILLHTGRNPLNLLWFYPFATLRALFARDVRHVHLGDNLMLPVGLVIKAIRRLPVSLTLYGLEITYPNALYQLLFVRPLRHLDILISISRATAEQAIALGLDPERVSVLPCGINPGEMDFVGGRLRAMEHLQKAFERPLEGKKILLTSGRLEKRKGACWFVEHVMPGLDDSYVYIISGKGPDFGRIQSAILERGLEDRVLLPGRTDEETLRALYCTANVFVMPNIHIEGDMEGFGIVLIEAGSVGLPVVASRIEGIQDAVLDGITGYLVEEQNAEEFLKAIHLVCSGAFNAASVRKAVESHFAWERIGQRYRELFRSIASET